VRVQGAGGIRQTKIKGGLTPAIFSFYFLSSS
jgi:hypothetical protein